MTYNTVFIEQRADPYIVRADNGIYYFTASVPAYDCIVLRASESLEGLKNAPEKEIWHRHESGPESIHIWAPELHYLFGSWYMYYSGGDKDDIWKIRPYVLRCEGNDPMKDAWVECGPMQAAENDPFSFTQFSLDATVFSHRGKNYYIWAEKVGSGQQISNLYIAEMKDASHLCTVQELLSSPDYEWERRGFWVNEGPGVIKHNHKIFVTYSASDTGPDYCIGLLSIDEDKDLLDPRNWEKKRSPILKSDEKKKIYGPGHNCFTTDEEGNVIMVYHARTEKEITGNPLYNPNRHTMLMKVEWDKDGAPLLHF